jgi:hypothetical protein
MTLLRQIQDAAVDSSVHLPDVLRRCKLLGARLGNDEFKRWVDRELNGYSKDDELPNYRILNVDSLGHFIGVGGSQFKNAPIPPMAIPKKYHDMVCVHRMAEPISSLSELLRGGDGENFQVPWPADLIALVGREIYQYNSCLAAWKVIPRGAIAGMVDTVRTRILSFAIEIEANAPNAGEAAPNTLPLPQKEVSNVFNTYIMGGVGNLAAGGRDFAQASQVTVQEGDFSSLRDLLCKLDVPAEEISTLENSIKDDAKDAGPGKLGPKTSSWVGRMVQKAAEGTLKIGTSAAASVIGKAIAKYLGLE